MPDSNSPHFEFLGSLFDFDDTWSYYIKVLLSVLILCRLVSVWQTGPITMHFNSKNKLLADFAQNVRLREMRFRPWLFALYPAA